VTQARLVLLLMINAAQLWILAATVEAALAHRFSALVPLVIASGVCFAVTLTIVFWWRPASRRYTSSGYLKK
jgi:type VI protein secretion system component VasK